MQICTRHPFLFSSESKLREREGSGSGVNTRTNNKQLTSLWICKHGQSIPELGWHSFFFWRKEKNLHFSRLFLCYPKLLMSFVHRKRDGCARGRLFISRGSIGVKNGMKALFSHVCGRSTRRIWPFLSLTNGSFPSPADRLFTSLFSLFFSHHLDVIFRQAARSKMRLRWVCQFGKWNWDNQNLLLFLQEASACQ